MWILLKEDEMIQDRVCLRKKPWLFVCDSQQGKINCVHRRIPIPDSIRNAIPDDSITLLT